MNAYEKTGTGQKDYSRLRSFEMVTETTTIDMYNVHNERVI
jgi:hypothetical protein